MGETDWHVLDATHSLEHYLERSRRTALRRFTDHLNAGMMAHVIERTLRQEWRRSVEETAAWTRSEWQPAVRWTAYLPDLPVLDHLRGGDIPEWVGEDPIFAPLTRLDRHAPAAGEESVLRLLRPGHGDARLAERWLAEWRSLWPGADKACRLSLDRLVKAVRGHFERLARAGLRESSSTYRLELERAITRIFRRESGTAVALFCYLALLALDLERLRGGLMRRRLFEASYAETAA
jgi:hypothetical protein